MTPVCWCVGFARQCLLLATHVESGARHASVETANVVLEREIVAVELIMVVFDVFDLFNECVDAGLLL